ncbi:hypothetical protein EYF80_041505 [Liparis tanakae]|uniref:Secreted protein n=1 Tax=Liparis tanakae TaxID=230148 RepID=A0A4Z2G5E7_9TELE|nr:hypothetical protein EYF80_041505 [Liparis tanakae]
MQLFLKASSVLLLHSGGLICFICGEERTPPSDYTTYGQCSNAVAPPSSDVMGTNTSRMLDQYQTGPSSSEINSPLIRGLN